MHAETVEVAGLNDSGNCDAYFFKIFLIVREDGGRQPFSSYRRRWDLKIRRYCLFHAEIYVIKRLLLLVKMVC